MMTHTHNRHRWVDLQWHDRHHVTENPGGLRGVAHYRTAHKNKANASEAVHCSGTHTQPEQRTVNGEPVLTAAQSF